MKNWKKAIALVASAAALVSVAACGPSNAGGSSDSGCVLSSWGLRFVQCFSAV